LHHGEDKFSLHETAEYFNEGMGNKWFTNDFDEIDSMSITQNYLLRGIEGGLQRILMFKGNIILYG